MAKKNLSYIPALSIILALCFALIGVFVYLSAQDIAKTGKIHKEIKDLESRYASLKNEQANIKNTANADQSFQDYFSQWESLEGTWNNSSVIAKVNELAEQASVRVFETEAVQESGSDVVDEPTMNMGVPSRRGGDRRAPQRRSSVAATPNPSGVSTIQITLVGAFPDLMEWMSQVENAIGSARINKVLWTARSSEEVRLGVTLQYRKLR